MVAVKAILLLLQAAAVSLAVTRLPRPHTYPEVLTVARRVLDTVLKSVTHSSCSVFLVTDGTTSATAVYENVGQLQAPQGIGVFEVTARGENASVTQKISLVLGEALRLRQVLICVSVVVLSDDPIFLATFIDESYRSGLLVWTTKLFAITRRPIVELQDLQSLFSMTNSMLLSIHRVSGSPMCRMYVHLPYRAQGTQAMQVAYWRQHQGLTLTSHYSLFPEKFQRFSERPTLMVAAEEFPSQRAMMVDDPKAPGEKRLTFTGPMADIIVYLAEGNNFSYNYIRPPDGAWGNRQPNGSWTGMVGLVITDRADMGLGPFGATVSRFQAVDFSWPVRIDAWRIMAGRGRTEVDPWGFLLPLTTLVWTAIVAALLVLSAAVLFLSSCVTIKMSNKDKRPVDNFNYIRILLQQDMSVSDEWWWWERLVLAVWLLMTLVLTRSYSGNLMALLAVRHIPQPYQSLRDVLDDPSVIMIWQKNSMFSQYIQTAKSGMYREVRELEKEERLIYRFLGEFPKAADVLVRTGDHVLIDADINIKNSMARDVTRTGRCDYYISRDIIMSFPLVMIFKMYSPLAPAILTRIMRMNEAGLVDQWLRHTEENSTTCTNAPKKIIVISSLSLANLWGMFVVIGGGIILSLHVFVLEVIMARALGSRSP